MKIPNKIIEKTKRFPLYLQFISEFIKYFEMGGFHIVCEEGGYYIFIDEHDMEAEICNGYLIAITELGIDILTYTGKDKNNCNTFEGWKSFAAYDFTTLGEITNIVNIINFYIKLSNWPDLAKKKIDIAYKKAHLKMDFE